MLTTVTIIHILVSLGLILVVLLQTGKGTEMGAVFGGSSSTLFGSSGAGNFLTRLTTAMAIVFMVTSLTLGYFSGRRGTRTVLDRQPITAETSSTPRAPEAPQQKAKSGDPTPLTSQPPAGGEKK
jgi:preprotein translocase subunit SecG